MTRYIRLTDEFFSNPLFGLSDRASPQKLTVLMWCINRANYKDNGVYHAGEFQASYTEIATALGTSVTTIGKWIKSLLADGYLEKCKYTNASGQIVEHSCKYKVVNYGKYTAADKPKNTEDGQKYFD